MGSDTDRLTHAVETVEQYDEVIEATAEGINDGEVRIEYDGTHQAALFRDMYALGFRVDSLATYLGEGIAIVYFTDLEYGMDEHDSPTVSVEEARSLLEPQYEHSVIPTDKEGWELYVSDNAEMYPPENIDLPVGWEVQRRYHLGWEFRPVQNDG